MVQNVAHTHLDARKGVLLRDALTTTNDHQAPITECLQCHFERNGDFLHHATMDAMSAMMYSTSFGSM